MKRTAIKPGTTPMQRGTPLRASKTPINRAGMDTLRARHPDTPAVAETPTPPAPRKVPRTTLRAKKIPPNAAERRWMDAVAKLGCIVCRRQGRGYVPCAVHHIVEGGRRLGHMYTIGLCDPGHHQNSPDRAEISRHPHRARFTAAYGSEYALLAATRELIEAQAQQGAPESGITLMTEPDMEEATA